MPGFTPETAAEAREAAKLAERRSFDEKFASKPTRKTAIDLFCQQCMGGTGNEGWKRLIRECPSSNCPLYQFRPYK